MTRLIKKDVPFVWIVDCEATIQTLKDKLVNALILVLPEVASALLCIRMLSVLVLAVCLCRRAR